MKTNLLKTRWAAIGAAVAVTLGAGGLGISYATSPAGAAAFVPITPCRVVDTRPAPDTVGARTSPLGPDETFTVDAHGDNGNCTDIPTGATGLSLNVTALGATTGTFLTLWATGAPQPTASNLNPQPGQPPTPNAVTTSLSAGGQFNIFNKVGSVNVIVDIVGYYTDHNHDDRYDDVQADVDAKTAAVALSTTDTVVVSATVETPTSGYVIVNSGGFVWNSSVANVVRCSITTGTTVDLTVSVNADLDTPGASRQAIGTTRGFTVNKAFIIGNADEMTVNVVCDTNAGTASYADAHLTAIFVPDPDAFGLVFVPLGDAPVDDGSDG